MSSGPNTPNLGLHNWIGTDDVLRSEWNDNFTKIDTFAGQATKTLAFVKNQVISSSPTQLFTFTPASDGIYTVKVYLRVITAATNITLTIAYADSGGPQSYTPPALNNTSVAVGSHGVIDYTFEAAAGTAITLTVTVGTTNQVYATAALVEVA